MRVSTIDPTLQIFVFHNLKLSYVFLPYLSKRLLLQIFLYIFHPLFHLLGQQVL